jgi:hypothetical protein
MARKHWQLYLKVKGDELWVSPEGTKQEYFFTKKKTNLKKINSFKKELRLFKK